MTATQQQQYLRGLEIAKRDALTVLAHGTRKSDGAAIYAVPSRSEQNRWHLVVVTGLELTCDCHAAQYGRYCAHRAAVRARLELEAQVRRDTRERAVEQALHEAARALNVRLETTPARATGALTRSPRLADDTRAISIFK